MTAGPKGGPRKTVATGGNVVLRLGILGCDTSHVVEFTKRLHHVDVAQPLWVDGARVVAAWPGTSAIVPADRVAGYIDRLSAMGVEIVGAPEDLHGKIDALLVESQCGSDHRALAVPYLLQGVPTFVDKPFACTAEDATAMVEAAGRGGAPILSASALRFARETQSLGIGAIRGAFTYTPGELHPLNPGLFHYGVHGVEQLYALMGPGCTTVRCVRTEGADDVLGIWGDGRTGGVRALRGGAASFGFAAFGDKGNVARAIDMTWPYSDMLRVIVRVLHGEPSPVSGPELIEAIAFQQAAIRSAEQDGRPVSLA